MNRRNQFGTALIVLAVVLFTLPALFPIQAVLTHDTNPGTFSSKEQLQEEGIEIVAYENLTERGQELYAQTLEAGGEYRIPVEEGATDFEYLTGKERMQAYENSPNRPGSIVIERPENSDLPEADEPFNQEPRNTGRAEDEQRRQQVQRYDMMETATGPPPLGAISQLLRLAAALLAVLALGVGGYLLSSN